MIVYIAGKISGNPEYKKQFAAAAARLRQQGLEVINPAMLPQMEYHRYPPINLAMIDAADGLLLLPGWRTAPAQRGKQPTPGGWARRFLRSSHDAGEFV